MIFARLVIQTINIKNWAGSQEFGAGFSGGGSDFGDSGFGVIVFDILFSIWLMRNS